MSDNKTLQWKDQTALIPRSIVAVASTPDGEYIVRNGKLVYPSYRLTFGGELLLVASTIEQCKERAQQHHIGFQYGNQVGKDFKRLVEDNIPNAVVSLDASGLVRVSGESYTFRAETIAADTKGVLGFLRARFSREKEQRVSDKAPIIWHERDAKTAAGEAYIAIIDGRVCVVGKIGGAWDVKLDGETIKINMKKELILKAVEEHFSERS